MRGSVRWKNELEINKIKKGRYISAFFYLLFTTDPVFFKPGFEGCVFGRGGGVAATAGVADAEELFLDGRAAVEIVFDAHVVAGAKPAVGVAVEEYAARFLPVVGAG